MRCRDSYFSRDGIAGTGGLFTSKSLGRALNLVEYRRFTKSDVCIVLQSASKGPSFRATAHFSDKTARSLEFCSPWILRPAAAGEVAAEPVQVLRRPSASSRAAAPDQIHLAEWAPRSDVVH